MDKVRGHEVGPQVCKALGLDSTQVRSITIRIVPNDAVTVVVERFITMGSIQGAMLELTNEQYELVHRKTSPVETQ